MFRQMKPFAPQARDRSCRELSRETTHRVLRCVLAEESQNVLGWRGNREHEDWECEISKFKGLVSLTENSRILHIIIIQ